jgi:hypothetical protein
MFNIQRNYHYVALGVDQEQQQLKLDHQNEMQMLVQRNFRFCLCET